MNAYQSIIDDITARLEFSNDVRVFLRRPFSDDEDIPAIFIIPTSFSISDDNGIKVKGPMSIELLVYSPTFEDLLHLITATEKALGFLTRVPNSVGKIDYKGWRLADKQAISFKAEAAQLSIQVNLIRDKERVIE